MFAPCIRGEGQGEEDGERGLHAEVDGEEGGLQGCELRSGQHAVGLHARNEGLEDFGAEEGAVGQDVVGCGRVELGECGHGGGCVGGWMGRWVGREGSW